jgi:hypothetical protein
MLIYNVVYPVNAGRVIARGCGFIGVPGRRNCKFCRSFPPYTASEITAKKRNKKFLDQRTKIILTRQKYQQATRSKNKQKEHRAEMAPKTSCN